MGERSVSSTLLDWYDVNQRLLPWRDSQAPYSVWVSEIMLQQTRVDTVVPRFMAWMQRFPTVQDLAAASEGDVLAAWSGLGYYRRARLMHKAARHVAKTGWPETSAELRALPGIGEYTAAAIASICFGERVAVLDGNVERVVARYCGLPGARGDTALRHAVREWTARHVSSERPGDWNQATMELGATVCTPQSPTCATCPLADTCKSRGAPQGIPATPKRAALRVEVRHFAVVRRDGKVAFVREPGTGLLGGLWRLPGGTKRDELAARVQEETGMRINLGAASELVTHRFTHRVWHMHAHAATAVAGEPNGAVRWMDDVERSNEALSTAVRKLLAQA